MYTSIDDVESEYSSLAALVPVIHLGVPSRMLESQCLIAKF